MATIENVSGMATTITSKPRLMILKMVLENFKSYGGVKEIGPFHKSFSSVVGPNGSGKSNVIDAMLFVFGKRASKMRMSKVSELIHKSAEYPDLDYARVSVYFQEIIDDGSEDKYTVVPGSQLIVTRTAQRNNSSKYYINTTTSSFSEVTALLKDRGIDLDNNRFLILQGEVEQISMMKPKAAAPGEEGLLEYLEDIIGSNVYVNKIAEAEKVMEALSTERGEKLHRVKAAEKEVTALESSKKEAEALLLKERDIQRQSAVLCQKTLFDTKATFTAAEAKHKDAMANLADAAQRKIAYEGSIATLTSRLNTASKSHEEATQKYGDAAERRAAAEREDIKLKENLQHAVRSAKKAEESIQKEAMTYADACNTVEKTKASMPDLEAAVARLQGEVKTEEKAYEQVLASLAGETEGLRTAMEEKQRKLAPAVDAARTVSSSVESLRTEAQLLKESMEAGGKELAAVNAQIAATAESASTKQAELEAAKREQAVMQARKLTIVGELDAVQAKEAKVNEDVKELRAKVEDAKASMSSASSGGVLENQLKLACKKGGPLAHIGFHGRLGDLGAIDAKFDVAISTACGALNWLVVDDTESGQACVEYMRAKSLGRAKFICLDKVDWVRERMSAKFTAPAGVTRLFDLVRIKDDKFKAAFYFALRDTLVADNIDQAVKIAYNGPGGAIMHRVVTLAGELIDTSGTMSGGGRVAKKGGMSASIASDISPEELVAAEKELAGASTALAELKARRAALHAEQKDIEKALPKLVTRISKLEMEIVALGRQKEDLMARVAKMSTAASSSAEDKARFTDVEKQLAAAQAEHAKLAKVAQALEAEVNELQRAILEAGGEKLRRGKARCDRAKEALESAERSLTKANADIKNAEKAAEKAKKTVEKAKAEILDMRATIQKLKEESDALVEVAMQAERQKKEAEEERHAAEKVLNAAKTEYTTAERELRVLRESEREFTTAADEAEAIWMSLKKKIAQWQSKLEALAADYEQKIKEAIADKEADMISSGELESEASAPGAAESKSDGAEPSKRAAKVTFDEPLTLPEVPEATLKGLTLEDIQYNMNMAEAERDSIAKKVNMQSIVEYRTKNREYLRRVADLDQITQARDASRKQWEGLRKQRLDEFMSGFSIISLKLKEMYQMITLGGDAELELVDTCDPFAEGIMFQVRPPKKSWKNICNLSGGEKTLSSLALVFALHHYKPTPLYVMDEIDAALDFKNVSIVANYIKERTRDAQFVIISLRNNMFELADRLVGIYKTMDVTKSITINPKEIAAECGVSTGGSCKAIDEKRAEAKPTKVLGEKSNIAH